MLIGALIIKIEKVRNGAIILWEYIKRSLSKSYKPKKILLISYNFAYVYSLSQSQVNERIVLGNDNQYKNIVKSHAYKWITVTLYNNLDKAY